ncbi:leukotoxin LktA family filamentous adhesin [bacterium]|nr:leukotoxin LktA family filamentous adhesin [bacterium]
MNKRRNTRRRILATLLTGCFMLNQTMTFSVLASEITGVTNGGHGTFDITPEGASGNVGFRNYDQFTLDQGDIANLIFQYGTSDIETFINLVQDRVIINGIVNSMKDGNFYNGKAVFISPKGVIVGASGVLNVGSLGIYTPDPANKKYQDLVNSQTAANWSAFENADSALQTTGPKGTGEGIVDINGKIFTNGDITIKAGDVNIGQNAGLVAGIDANKMNLILTQEQAKNLFNQLVNTDNLTINDNFASNGNAKISIKSAGFGEENKIYNTGINVAGTVVNMAKGNGGVYLENRVDGGGGINVSGNIYNSKGVVDIYNQEGNLILSGNIANKGNEMYITNSPQNTESELKISGKVENNGKLDVINLGSKGLNITGTVNNNGDATLRNGYNASTTKTTAGFNVSGTINNTGDLTMTNTASGVDGMNITGDVHAGKNATLVNAGQAGLNIKDSGKVSANKDLAMYNTGLGGTFVASNARVNAEKNIYIDDNSTGGTRVQGLINAKDNVEMHQNGGGDVVIGDNTDNDNYITAGNDLTIIVNDGSILNWAGIQPNAQVLGIEDAKILLNAGGDLTMDVTDGTIGQEVGAGCYSDYCTGISDAPGTRDYARSINGNVKGKVNATTTKAAKPDDLVINYAAIDSDMNIDAIKADGRVILTTDYNRKD